MKINEKYPSTWTFNQLQVVQFESEPSKWQLIDLLVKNAIKSMISDQTELTNSTIVEHNRRFSWH